MYPFDHFTHALLYLIPLSLRLFFFFFNDTATTEIYTLSLHDALPVSGSRRRGDRRAHRLHRGAGQSAASPVRDRKSTRLNSSHLVISYAVFCLKKKKKIKHSVDVGYSCSLMTYRYRHRHVSPLATESY